MPDRTQVLRVALPVPLPTLFDYLPPAGARPARTGSAGACACPSAAASASASCWSSAPADGAGGAAPAPACSMPPAAASELLQTSPSAPLLPRPPGEVLATALPGALREGQPLPETTAAGWRSPRPARARWRAPGRGRPRALLERLRRRRRPRASWRLDFDGWREAARALAAAARPSACRCAARARSRRTAPRPRPRRRRPRRWPPCAPAAASARCYSKA
jgi:primosomal protein N' (replication factor Y)